MIPPAAVPHWSILIQKARVVPSGPQVSTLLRHAAAAPLTSIHWRWLRSVIPAFPIYLESFKSKMNTLNQTKKLTTVFFRLFQISSFSPFQTWAEIHCWVRAMDELHRSFCKEPAGLPVANQEAHTTPHCNLRRSSWVINAIVCTNRFEIHFVRTGLISEYVDSFSVPTWWGALNFNRIFLKKLDQKGRAGIFSL